MINNKMKNKKLLILTPYFPVDSKDTKDIFVKNQVDVLSTYFNKVYVISPVSLFRFLKEREKYKKRKIKYNNIVAFYPLYLNFPFPIIREMRFIKQLWVRNYYKAILKVIQKENLNIDLIHSHFTWPSGAAAVKIKKILKHPVTITSHIHLNLSCEETRIDKDWINTWKEADAIIRVNKKDVKTIKKYNKNVYFIANGYDKREFTNLNKKSARRKLHLKEDKNIILNVAHLVPFKNQRSLILAANELRKKGKDFIVYIVGDGPLKKELDQLIKKLNLQNYVKLVGPKPHSEIPLWMNAADVFVLPSFSESFGIVQLEALACGTPVVATINNGSRTVITSKDYGLLLKNPNNFKGLAELIDKALNKQWNKKKILNYARKLSWQEISKKILKVYETVLENKNKGGK